MSFPTRSKNNTIQVLQQPATDINALQTTFTYTLAQTFHYQERISFLNLYLPRPYKNLVQLIDEFHFSFLNLFNIL